MLAARARSFLQGSRPILRAPRGAKQRAEQAGWVARSADPTDRRGVLVALTELGQRVLAGSLATYIESADRALGGLDDAERAALESLLRKLLLAIEGEF